MSSDWELLDRALEGREKAWQLLIEKHAPGLTRMAFLIAGSLQSAQELVNDAFVEIYKKQPGHRNGSFRAYLSTVVYHRALKEKKRVNSKLTLDGIILESSADSPLEHVLKKEKDRVVARIIRSLDPAHREILILRFYGGHSYETIAGMTGLPLGTVKSRMFHAVKMCRERIQEKGWL